jgi:hypothetical protein
MSSFNSYLIGSTILFSRSIKYRISPFNVIRSLYLLIRNNEINLIGKNSHKSLLILIYWVNFIWIKYVDIGSCSICNYKEI